MKVLPIMATWKLSALSAVAVRRAKFILRLPASCERSSLASICAAAALSLALVVTVNAGQTFVASATPEQIADLIVDQFNKTDGLHVKWQVELKIHSAVDDAEAILFATQPIDEYAVKGTKRYRRFFHHGTTIPVAGRFMESTYVMDGRIAHSQVVRHRGQGKEPRAESYFLAFDADQGTAGQREQAVHYFENIGSPLYDGKYLDIWRRHAYHTKARDLKAEQPFSIVSALRSGQYQAPGRERIDDAECVVFELPGMDKIWLDPNRGYALVKREWRWKAGGMLMMVYRNSDFKKAAEGLWLPLVSTRVAYEYSDAESERPHFTTTTKVTSIEAGSGVPESLFEFRPADGSFAVDFTKVQKVGGGGWKGITYSVGVTPERTKANLEAAILQQTDSLLDVVKFWRWPKELWFLAANVTVLTALVVKRLRARHMPLGTIAAAT